MTHQTWRQIPAQAWFMQPVFTPGSQGPELTDAVEGGDKGRLNRLGYQKGWVPFGSPSKKMEHRASKRTPPLIYVPGSRSWNRLQRGRAILTEFCPKGPLGRGFCFHYSRLEGKRSPHSHGTKWFFLRRPRIRISLQPLLSVFLDFVLVGKTSLEANNSLPSLPLS